MERGHPVGARFGQMVWGRGGGGGMNGSELETGSIRENTRLSYSQSADLF